jgi:DNA-3-methyladenine glycosylase II
MDYLLHLSKDKKLAPVLKGQAPLQIKPHKHVYIRLIASIMSQQLSTRVADVIYNRFIALYDTKFPSPEQILETPHETLRGIGLSNAKVTYVHNVARFAVAHGLDIRQLKKMSNEEVIAHLTAIKGVGKWTVEMLLMFTLGREDVFPMDDWGIQSTMIQLYKLDPSDKKLLREKLLKISSKWAPYRTYACMHLWRWKDGE